MAMFWVDGVELPTPSEAGWTETDVASADSGRTDDGVMHLDLVSQKIKYSLAWNNPDRETVSKVLKMFIPKYFSFTFENPVTGVNETRTFYKGDRTAPYKIWNINKKRFSQLSFNIIER